MMKENKPQKRQSNGNNKNDNSTKVSTNKKFEMMLQKFREQ